MTTSSHDQRGIRLPSLDGALFALATAGLAGGGVAVACAARGVADAMWAGVTALAVLPALWWVAQALRHRQLGADLIAVLALLGTLATREFLAGAVIAVMLSGGRVLESRASRRARRDLSALVSLAPRLAHRKVGGEITTVAADEVRPGDLLVVRAGEVVPVDGRVEGAAAVVDESVITGEPLPAERQVGEVLRSGATNAGDPFEMVATTSAEDSTYSGIVRLAREAEAASAPFVRMADRYAAVFLPLTLALAGVAWLVTADPVRAVAVLVVATPCPLILAAPVAFVSGLSRCARRGVIVKGGGALERLARARVLLFDKTGTVTEGRPTLTEIIAPDWPHEEVLRLAAALDQVSPHVLASALVNAAREEGLELPLPEGVREQAGQGIRGRVAGHTVAVGKARWVAAGPPPAWIEDARARAAARGSVTVFVAVDDTLVAAVLFDDRLRADAPRTFRLLRSRGIERAVMITGDRRPVAESIGSLVGADTVIAEQTPADKVASVRAESQAAATLMVGDGVNDAPALAVAGVGVALGARGATASSQSADVVVTVDRLERVAETLAIARRTRAIATQSVLAGMLLSLAAMGVAAAGFLVPVAGAILQEAIDIAVIVNALRALGPGRDRQPRLRGDEAELVRRLDEEHRSLRPKVERLRRLADTVAELPPEALRAQAHAVHRFVADELGPHEREEERHLYPAVARAIGGADPTGAMSRGHAEIAELTRQLGALADEVERAGPTELTRSELRRVLHELYAVLRLHFAQEEESYFVLAEERQPSGGAHHR